MNELFKPVPNILPWEIEDEPTRKELASYARALDKLVSIGTHLLMWELKDDSLEANLVDEKGTVSLYFKRLLEILDSIARLIEVGATTPSTVLLRTLLEIDLSFEFLLKSETEKKCYCIIVTDLFREIKEWEDPTIASIVLDANLRKKDAQNLLNFPNLSQVKSQYLQQNVKDGTNKIINNSFKWYNLFTTLNNLGQLAKELGRYNQYKIVYQLVGSNAIHSTDLMKENLVMDDGIPAIVQMRNPTEALEVVRQAFAIGKRACNHFSKRRTDVQKKEYIWAIQTCKKQHQKIALLQLYTH